MSRNLERAILLYRQDRLDLAEKELRQILVTNPHHPPAHAILAMCLSDMERFEEATSEARHAIHLAPDMPLGHYALAYVLNDRERLEEAREAIQEAIRLEPGGAEHFGLLATIELSRRDWSKALAAAEKGLELDPEDLQCTNVRAMALVKLGRNSEANATIDAALERDPENAITHANMGWTLLHRGDPNKAMGHFREALRLDASLDFARAGIVEAMKARNIIYRWLLGYFLWMARLSGKAQWGIIIGLYVLAKVLNGVAKANPVLAPYVFPLLGLYMLFVLLTWIGSPLFNLLLRFNRFGRLALSQEEITAANWLAVCLGGGALFAVVYFLTYNTFFLLVAIFSGTMAIPVSVTLRSSAGWPRKVLWAYTLILAGLGTVAFLTLLLDPADSNTSTGVRVCGICIVAYLIGLILFQWVANAVGMARVRR